MLAFSPLEAPRRVTVRARAKVNLGLEVLSRRDDGYHELCSLLWAIDLADRVTLEATPTGIAVECDAPGVPTSPENLAWRAAELVRHAAGVERGVRIRIDKGIPVAAGLGGGSTDAAAVLLGLRRLWRLPLSRARLEALAPALGMDVPFFLGRGPAVASRRGEAVQAVSAPQTVALVLVNPGFPLATRDVYGRLRPSDFTSGAHVRALVRALSGGSAALAPRVWNGLEGVVARLWRGLGEVKAALLRAGCLGAVMSGSGPTVVGITRSRAAALRAQAALAGQPWRTWVTRTVVGPALAIERAPATSAAPAERGEAWGVAKR